MIDPYFLMKYYDIFFFPPTAKTRTIGPQGCFDPRTLLRRRQGSSGDDQTNGWMDGWIMGIGILEFIGFLQDHTGIYMYLSQLIFFGYILAQFS